MFAKLIETKKEYQSYLDRADKMFDNKVKNNTPEGKILQLVLLLIKQYEDEHYPIPMVVAK